MSFELPKSTINFFPWADLVFYNLTVLWSELAIAAFEVWAELDRRQALLGMVGKLPKDATARLVSSEMPLQLVGSLKPDLQV
jgi:phosphoribosyl-ATP pyrophosphohydrolase